MLSTTRARAIIAVIALGSALALAGCAAATPESAETQGPGQTQQQRPGGGGVAGLIAAISDDVMQVQDTDEQTAVSYTSDTTISSQVDGTLSDVTVGSCVTAITATDAEAATSVIVTDAVDGECTGGFADGGPVGGPPDDAPTDLPSGAPTDFPTDGAALTGAFASGLVTSVSGSTITVDAVDAEGTTTSTDVGVDGATTYTVTVAADATALVVGQCVVAQGESDDAGGFAATSLLVSEPGDDGCTPSFVSGQGGFPGGPGGLDSTTDAG